MDTSIKIDKKTVKKLNLMKYQLGLKSIDAVINALISIVNKVELANKIKEENKK
jgi:hypothetical protein